MLAHVCRRVVNIVVFRPENLYHEDNLMCFRHYGHLHYTSRLIDKQELIGTFTYYLPKVNLASTIV